MVLPLHLNHHLVSYLRVRTRFFDAHVVQATASAPRQIVIIGAGYDDRALRFRTPGVRFVEVDHPATQRDKRERLAKLGIDATDVTFVGVDLETDDPETALLPLLDFGAATTIICEAVLPYLTRPRVETVLGGLRALPGAPVQLVADLPVTPAALQARVALTVLRMGTTLASERIRTELRPEEVAPLLRSAGWRELARTTGRELGMSGPAIDTLFVVAGGE
jgi:methyltransferase (TIGR00027 family)